jgi:hypothetical protein
MKIGVQSGFRSGLIGSFLGMVLASICRESSCIRYFFSIEDVREIPILIIPYVLTFLVSVFLGTGVGFLGGLFSQVCGQSQDTQMVWSYILSFPISFISSSAAIALMIGFTTDLHCMALYMLHF